MVYAVVNINGNVVPAEVTFGTITSGTGTIKTFTSNNVVIGSSTSFTTELGNLYVIRNSSNVYVGKISNIANNTYATLTTNANVAISSAAFKYQSYTATAITYDEHLGNGNISTFSANNTVIGNNTTFLTQLNVGYQIFDSTEGNLIGVIRTVTSNTSATLNTVSAYPQVDMPFRVYNPVTPNKSNLFTPYNNTINNSLISWGRSGLIQNIAQVKSYHLPMPDPVTGVLVNFPATIHQSSTIANIVTHKYEENHLDNISNFQTTKDNIVVKLFDEDDRIIGGSTAKAVETIPINKVVSKIVDIGSSITNFGNTVAAVASSVYGNPQLGIPGGLVVDTVPAGFEPVTGISVINTPYTAYQGPGGNVVYLLNSNVATNHISTSVDVLCHTLNLPPPSRITDSYEDARAYFSTKNRENLSDSERADLAARSTKTFAPERPKMLKATGVPAVIPGQLNAILHDEDPDKRTYSTPQYDKFIENEFNASMLYNKDLPKSVLNVPPPTE